MSTADTPLTCDELALHLADVLDDDASDETRAAVEAHAAGCADCGALVADLGALRRDAAALPLLTPSRDLWSGIAERIDAPVVALDIPRVDRGTSRRTWARPALAAAALVLVTAGITHVLTRVSIAPAAPPAMASAAATPVTAVTPPSTEAAAPATAEFTSTATERSTPAAAGGRRVPAQLASAAPLMAAPLMKEAQPVYDREIGKLRELMRTRRSQLDPSTVAVLEQSIAVIDSAIAQSRAALARDPASGFLATQLNHSLEKKVELLRTAALLPART